MTQVSHPQTTNTKTTNIDGKKILLWAPSLGRRMTPTTATLTFFPSTAITTITISSLSQPQSQPPS